VIKLRRMKWAGHVALFGRGEAYTVFWWGNLRERPLGRPRRKWECNMKMDGQGVRCGVMDWIELAQNKDRWWALVNAVINIRVL
jgi:hypothetical protein